MGYLRLAGKRPSAIAAGVEQGHRVSSVLVAGLVATGVLLMLQAVTQAIDFGVFDLRIRALDCDNHASVFGIASLLAQAACAAACGWRGVRTHRRRWAWLCLGALVAGLVLIRGLTAFNATALAAPLAAVLWWLTWRDPGVRLVVWAGLLLMATSLLLHKVGLDADASTASDYTWAYQLVGMVKHGAELAGWLLLATGVVAAGERRSKGVAFDEIRPPEVESSIR
jgi:hypothetical protein